MRDKNSQFYMINRATTSACRIAILYICMLLWALGMDAVDREFVWKHLYLIIIPFGVAFVFSYSYQFCKSCIPNRQK